MSKRFSYYWKKILGEQVGNPPPRDYPIVESFRERRYIGEVVKIKRKVLSELIATMGNSQSREKCLILIKERDFLAQELRGARAEISDLENNRNNMIKELEKLTNLGNNNNCS